MPAPARPIRTALCLGAAAALVAAAGATAATPMPGARFEAHDHETMGHRWHVDFVVAGDGRHLNHVMLYARRCGETVTTGHVAVRDDGSVASGKPFTTSNRGAGTWRLDAQFQADDRVEGSFRITTPSCDSGVKAFSARAMEDHSGHRVVFGHGYGTYPDLAAATPRRRAQVRTLWRRTRLEAARRFPTYRVARRLGYVRLRRHWERPVLFHVRNEAYDRDGRVLDPAHPESLVYWWPRRGHPILLGFMYRAPAGRRPPLAGHLLGWHQHHHTNPHLAPTIMTHVWLAKTLRMALANCLPVAALEAALPRFHYERSTVEGGPETSPCHRR